MTPTITVLCGSTRFYDEFQRANYDLTMAGHIVLSVGFYPHAPQAHGEGVGCTPEQKVALDELHKRKIDLADEVLVLNPGGYIGESTRSEIDYATATGKQVRYLVPDLDELRTDLRAAADAFEAAVTGGMAAPSTRTGITRIWRARAVSISTRT
jgi:hypothetical protein